MEGNDDILEEDYMLISQRNRKATDDTCKDVKQFSSAIELVSLMDQAIEALIHGFSYHFSSGYQL